MAKIIKTNGKIIEVEPINGKDFQLDEMRKHIGGGYIEITYTKDNKLMVVDEEGKLKGFEPNLSATENHKYNDLIVGDVLICEPNQIE
jgi:hypothetical protein